MQLDNRIGKSLNENFKNFWIFQEKSKKKMGQKLMIIKRKYIKNK